MMKEEKSFKEKIREYKKEILVGAGIVTFSVGALVFVKNKDKIQKAFESLVEKNNVSVDEAIDYAKDKVDVSGHTRNLPKNHTASKKQKKLAQNNSVSLDDNQTYISPYKRNMAA